MGFKELLIQSYAKADHSQPKADIKKTQQESLEIFDAFKQVCEKHGIVYMMGGGSALGTVRHKGFIPWDDDIDINMPRDDFERFKVCSQEMGERFRFCAPNCGGTAVERFGKIFLMNEDDGNWQTHTSIDIFVIENLPKNKFSRWLKGLYSSFAMGLASISLFYKSRTKKTRYVLCSSVRGSVSYYFRVVVGFIISFIPTERLFDFADSANQMKKKTGVSGVPSGRKHYYGEQFPTEVYLPTKEGMFEGRVVPIENNVELYLTNLYGSDYMRIPPEHERESHIRG